MSPFGKIFHKNKDNPETEQDLSADEDELSQGFQLEPPAKNSEPALPNMTGDVTPEGQPDAAATGGHTSALPEDEQKQPEKKENKEDDLMALFGTTAHGGGELQALSNDIEDIPVEELLADLQSIAAALRRRAALAGEGRQEEAA